MPDDGTDSFEGIDLLDPTKLVPEELAEVQPVGKMTLKQNPTNYFAETEQVAFRTGHLVPGIEVTDDPLMQARLFSYLDAQLTRLGGPNFARLPINRPHCPVNDMLRGGVHQTAVHDGISPYLPNGIDQAPRVASEAECGYVQTPRVIEGRAVRGAPASFDDHFSQAPCFTEASPRSSRPTVEAFTFELGKVYQQDIKEREMAVPANVNSEPCALVAAGLGLRAPNGTPATDVVVSAALSQVVTVSGPIAGRKIAVIVDALVVADGVTSSGDIRLVLLLQEAFRHCKTVAAWGSGSDILQGAGIDLASPGVPTAQSVAKGFNDDPHRRHRPARGLGTGRRSRGIGRPSA